jgi:two-component system osmolarity sensor histidine kinase EnvZ
MRYLSLKRFLPRSLYGRAALILLVPIVTIQIVVSFAFIQRLYEDVTVQMTQNMVPQIALLAEAAGQSVGELEMRSGRLGVETRYPGAQVETRIRVYDLSGHAIFTTLQSNIDGLTGVDLVENRKAVRIGALVDGEVLEMVFPRSRVSARNPHQLIVLMLATGALMTLIAYLFLRNQLRPIKRLANAAEAFGKGEVVPYQPSGANEVRSAGGAFLHMRSRIERQTQQRTLMLSGVSHDLRTPLTRLKLGLSMQPDTKDNQALISDVTEMERLITAFLDFARSDATQELEPCDLRALVKEVAENATRAGQNLTLGQMPEAPVQMNLRPLAIKRALENLAGNATRYGTHALLSLEVLEKSVRITVEDDGPGIPEPHREEALKPFARLDASRNQNKGSGVGLGLSIAADIMRVHGGSLRLGDSAALGGLSVELVLPR